MIILAPNRVQRVKGRISDRELIAAKGIGQIYVEIGGATYLMAKQTLSSHLKGKGLRSSAARVLRHKLAYERQLGLEKYFA